MATSSVPEPEYELEPPVTPEDIFRAADPRIREALNKEVRAINEWLKTRIDPLGDSVSYMRDAPKLPLILKERIKAHYLPHWEITDGLIERSDRDVPVWYFKPRRTPYAQVSDNESRVSWRGD